MGNMIPTQNTTKPDDINTIRKSRVKYQDYLASIQANTESDVSNNSLTPETGSIIYKLIQKSYLWLKNNPNANLIEIMSNEDSTTAEIKRLMSVDIPKRKFLNTLIAVPTILERLIKEKIITADKQSAFLAIIKEEKNWYDKNQEIASKIDFTQEFQKINDSVSAIFVDQTTVNTIKSQIEYVQNIPTSQLKSKIAEYDSKKQEIKKEEVDVNSAFKIAISTALNVFFSLLFISLCIMCGSFAANIAIGRPPMYRVLYFIYGAFPAFAPFVFIYAIYKRITEGKLSVYSVLPTSIEPATTRIGKILWYPFYWIPDQHAIDEYNKFMATLPLQVQV
jgi:hypothetical protein